MTSFIKSIKTKFSHRNHFEVVYKSYAEIVYGFIRSRINDQEIAKDITQKVFIGLWNNRNRVDWDSDLKSYLLKIAYNQIKEYFRHIAKENELYRNLEEIDYTSFFNNQYSENELQSIEKQVKYAVNQLPKKCREIFYLKKFRGYTNQEISEKMGITPKTVENQMTHALKKIREKMKNSLIQTEFVTD